MVNISFGVNIEAETIFARFAGFLLELGLFAANQLLFCVQVAKQLRSRVAGRI